MKKERFALHAAVYLLLIKNNKILLLRRFNTGWRDGYYTMPAGHLDGNEEVIEAMSREAFEEIDISIKPENLEVIHTMHRNTTPEYIDFFLVAKKWKGTPILKEPDKSDKIGWYSLESLPSNTIPHVKLALSYYKDKVIFSETD